MKEKVKILLVNLVSIIVTLIIIELISMGVSYLTNKKSLELKNSANLIQKFRYAKAAYIDWDRFCYSFESEDNVKRPIMLLGCSYAHGSGLKKKQTLSYKLFKKTNRNVFNQAIPGSSIQFALAHFQSGEMKEDVPDAEYIIYVYINYHLARLYSYDLDYIETEINQRYELKNGELVKIKKPVFPWMYSLFTVKNIQKLIEFYKSKNEYMDYELFNAVMKETLKQARENYKDVKFVVLLYPSADYIEDKEPVLQDFEVEKLKSMGFIVLNAEDLTDKPIRSLDYRVVDKDHPSEQAWDAIVPALIKKLNL